MKLAVAVDAISILKEAQDAIAASHHSRAICAASAKAFANWDADSDVSWSIRRAVRDAVRAARESVRPVSYMCTGMDGVVRYSMFATDSRVSGYWWDRLDKMARLNALDRAMYWLTTQVQQ